MDEVTILSSDSVERTNKEKHGKKLSYDCYENLKIIVREIADDNNIMAEEVILKGTLKRIADELVFAENEMLDILIDEAQKKYQLLKFTSLKHADELKIPLLMKQNLDLVYDFFRPIVFYYFLKSISQ